MKPLIAVVDYGMGNLKSVSQAAMRAAFDTPYEVIVTQDPNDVDRAERVILPGQGAMRDCMHELTQSGLREAVLDAITQKPLLGICVGMQMLLEHSEEQDTPGLGLIQGKVRRFQFNQPHQDLAEPYKIPQIGWNQVKQRDTKHAMWANIPNHSWFYFVHSYYADPERDADVASQTEYGTDFVSAIARDNIFATQFHPEKSAECGLQLFQNFLTWSP